MVFPRSFQQLENEAKQVGAMATAQGIADSRAIQVLSAIIEDLAAQCKRLDQRLEMIEQRR